MKLSDFAELAANNKENIPAIIKMMAEAMENTDQRLGSIENAIRDLAGKVGSANTQLAETVGSVATLKKDNTKLKEEVAILSVWTGDKAVTKTVANIQQDDMILVTEAKTKPKNDGLVPSERNKQ
jgi:Ni2+-binding GTPase involved in maturation of urease and hydrogenase